MKKAIGIIVLLAVIAGMGFWAYKNTQSKKEATVSLVERGRYIVATSGCNDCHTPGYAMSEGKVDESLWLTGEKLGTQRSHDSISLRVEL